MGPITVVDVTRAPEILSETNYRVMQHLATLPDGQRSLAVIASGFYIGPTAVRSALIALEAKGYVKHKERKLASTGLPMSKQFSLTAKGMRVWRETHGVVDNATRVLAHVTTPPRNIERVLLVAFRQPPAVVAPFAALAASGKPFTVVDVPNDSPMSPGEVIKHLQSWTFPDWHRVSDPSLRDLPGSNYTEEAAGGLRFTEEGVRAMACWTRFLSQPTNDRAFAKQHTTGVVAQSPIGDLGHASL